MIKSGTMVVKCLVYTIAGCIAVAGTNSFAQSVYTSTEYRFQHYDTKDGLANEFASNIVQDSMGFIWVQYYGGFSRFDGYNFKTYRHDAKDSLRSALNFILGVMLKDDAGNIWITQKYGFLDLPEVFAKHDRKSDGFIKYEINLSGAGINTSIFEESGNKIWIGTDGEGLFYYDFKTDDIKSYSNPHGDYQKQKRQNSITDLKKLGSSLLLTTAEGLWIFDKHSKLFKRPACPPSDTTLLYHTLFDRILDSPHVKEKNMWIRNLSGLIMLDSNFSVVKRSDFPGGIAMRRWARENDGVFWFVGATGRGLYRYDHKDGSFVSFGSNPGDRNTLPSENVSDVMVDRDQNIWVATDHGVSVLRKKDLKFYNTKIQKLWGNSIYKSNDAEYVIVTSRNQLLMSKVIPGRLDLLDFHPVPISLDVGVWSFCEGENTFWICSGSGIVGYPIDPKTGMFGFTPQITIKHDPINENSIRAGFLRNVWEDEDENLWVSQISSGVDQVRLNIPYGREGSVVRHDFGGGVNSFFYPEDKKSFWALYDKYLDLVHLGRGNVAPKREHMVSTKELAYSMLKTKDGKVLLGTNNNLYETVSIDGKYKLNDTPIMKKVEANSVLEDSFGRLWIYSDNKLLCYDRTQGYTTVFDEREGINHFRAANLSWMHTTSSGEMMMCSVDGITAFEPAKFHPNRLETHPILTSLQVNNSKVIGKLHSDEDFALSADISVLDELIIDYKHNNFSIEFSAMEMTAPEKNLYRHKLEGYDNDWIETDFRNRTATYTNLEAREYTFRVKASNHHGIWSDNERTLRIKVLPPPWKSTWAYTGYCIILIALLYAARKNIVQRERLKSNLKLAKVEREKEHFELEKAKEADKVKSAFFTNISHEFRTPLTLIKGPVQDVIEQFVTNQQELDRQKIVDQLKLVQRNSDHLLKLINQLLDLAKLESGSLTVDKSEGDLNSFLAAVTSSFSSLALQKNITLTTALPATRYLALFDKDKLETILINLINNAIKFTPAGGKVYVEVETEKTDHQQNADQLMLSVSDTGIGIPRDQQHIIFERFHQVSEAHKEVGTGIGLSLVKELIALMGGEISVTSEPGKGSTFTAVLPVEMVGTSALETKNAGTQQPGTEYQSPITDYHLPNTDNSKTEDGISKPHVLVVEDNADLRSFIISSLGKEFHFLEAADGKEGIEKAFEEVPDLIISDVMMPEMDGITMTGKLKKDTRTSHIPILLLTAKTSEESKLSGLGTGADDYLTKPFNKNELLLKVRNRIALQVKLREKIKLELLKESPKVEVQSADEQFLWKVKEAILARLGDEQLSVESLAEEIGLSRSQLFRKITALTGVSVNELIRTFRLQKAAQLLEQNWAPVTQVAYEVGFSNLSYFSKVFKEQYGVLPSEYAEKIR